MAAPLGAVAPTGQQLQALLVNAIKLHEGGRAGEAARLYKSILNHEPGNAFAKHFLGVLVMNEGGLEEALPLMRESVEAEPNNAAFHNNLGELHRKAGRPVDAVRSFEACLRLDSTFVMAYCNIGSNVCPQLFALN